MPTSTSWRLYRLVTSGGIANLIALPAVLAALGFAVASSVGADHYFPLDDAYIHLSYARSLAFGGTFGLNPGESSVGTSSPLWTMLLVPLFWVDQNPYRAVQAVSLASVVVYLAIAAELLWRALLTVSLGRRARVALTGLGALLLATNGSLGWMSLSGMETSLVLAVCACAVRSYIRRGLGVRTGVTLGVCLLARSTTMALVAAIVLVELASFGLHGIRRALAGLGCAGLVYAPFALYTSYLTGSAFPNTARGKTITFIGSGFEYAGWLHYWKRCLAFQQYVPALLLLSLAGLGALALNRRVLAPARRGRRAMLVLAVWSVLHVAQYTVMFQTIGQEGRYLSEWFYAATLVGTFLLGCCACQLPGWSWVALVVLPLGAQLTVLPYWRAVYFHDVAHVAQAYVPMARAVANDTPADARIASFDIGTLRYFGNRYVIDLGGLVDASAHPCLARRSCVEYVRQRGATHVMYPEAPDADRMTGIHDGAFAPRFLLREQPLVAFTAADYAAPTMTHSFSLQLYRIEGWFDREQPAQAIAAFRRSDLQLTDAHFVTEPDFEVLGYRTDTDHLWLIPEYQYTLSLWLAYRALAPLQRAKWLHVMVLQPESRALAAWFDVPLTDAIITPAAWPVGEALEERHTITFVPGVPPGRYVIRVHVSEEQRVDVRYPQLYPWLEVGHVDAIPSAMTPLGPI